MSAETTERPEPLEDAARRLARGDVEGAKRVYRAALEADPRAPVALASLAHLELAGGATELALELFERALEVAPARRPARLGHALALAACGRRRAGIAALEALVAEDATDDAAQDALAKLCLLAGRGAEAEAAWRAARAAAPERADVARNLGALLAATGRADEGRAELERGSRLATADDALWAQLGTVRLAQADADGAARAFETALALAPDADGARRGLALARAAQGRADEAAEIVARLAARRPADVALRVDLGVLLLAEGRYDEARAALVHALELDPDEPRARRHLARLEAEVAGPA
jgi:Tfp pilus assembly protein PilF